MWVCFLVYLLNSLYFGFVVSYSEDCVYITPSNISSVRGHHFDNLCLEGGTYNIDHPFEITKCTNFIGTSDNVIFSIKQGFFLITSTNTTCTNTTFKNIHFVGDYPLYSALFHAVSGSLDISNCTFNKFICYSSLIDSLNADVIIRNSVFKNLVVYGSGVLTINQAESFKFESNEISDSSGLLLHSNQYILHINYCLLVHIISNSIHHINELNLVFVSGYDDNNTNLIFSRFDISNIYCSKLLVPSTLIQIVEASSYIYHTHLENITTDYIIYSIFGPVNIIDVEVRNTTTYSELISINNAPETKIEKLVLNNNTNQKTLEITCCLYYCDENTACSVHFNNISITDNLSYQETVYLLNVTLSGNDMKILSNSAKNSMVFYIRGGPAQISDSTFEDNHGASGGAIYQCEGNLTVNNSTFIRNYGVKGGVLCKCDNYLYQFSNCTLDSNKANAGAVLFYESVPNQIPTICDPINQCINNTATSYGQIVATEPMEIIGDIPNGIYPGTPFKANFTTVDFFNQTITDYDSDFTLFTSNRCSNAYSLTNWNQGTMSMYIIFQTQDLLPCPFMLSLGSLKYNGSVSFTRCPMNSAVQNKSYVLGCSSCANDQYSFGTECSLCPKALIFEPNSNRSLCEVHEYVHRKFIFEIELTGNEESWNSTLELFVNPDRLKFCRNCLSLSCNITLPNNLFCTRECINNMHGPSCTKCASSYFYSETFCLPCAREIRFLKVIWAIFGVVYLFILLVWLFHLMNDVSERIFLSLILTLMISSYGTYVCMLFFDVPPFLPIQLSVTLSFYIFIAYTISEYPISSTFLYYTTSMSILYPFQLYYGPRDVTSFSILSPFIMEYNSITCYIYNLENGLVEPHPIFYVYLSLILCFFIVLIGIVGVVGYFLIHYTNMVLSTWFKKCLKVLCMVIYFFWFPALYQALKSFNCVGGEENSNIYYPWLRCQQPNAILLIVVVLIVIYLLFLAVAYKHKDERNGTAFSEILGFTYNFYLYQSYWACCSLNLRQLALLMSYYFVWFSTMGGYNAGILLLISTLILNLLVVAFTTPYKSHIYHISICGNLVDFSFGNTIDLLVSGRLVYSVLLGRTDKLIEKYLDVTAMVLFVVAFVILVLSGSGRKNEYEELKDVKSTPFFERKKIN
eukprot:TRINITY_DN23281_c0_g1_i1.p1 TRINITY_DN23281_c0_g1~~TRINITY_DN23281_c0_g1_i1.p1  ORF type:complete len:1142 (-),score=197.62 TRINITY_DN23281_c0_g1_i1:16-3441(-)